MQMLITSETWADVESNLRLLSLYVCNEIAAVQNVTNDTAKHVDMKSDVYVPPKKILGKKSDPTICLPSFTDDIFLFDHEMNLIDACPWCFQIVCNCLLHKSIYILLSHYVDRGTDTFKSLNAVVETGKQATTVTCQGAKYWMTHYILGTPVYVQLVQLVR
jgi:hypothetical protein